MHPKFLRASTLCILPLLGACAATAEPPSSAGSTRPAEVIANRPITPPPTRPRPTRPTPSTGGFVPPRVMNIAGLESVIGQSSAGLQQQFGVARLDVREGDVRKLQFNGEACVLDVYLYPMSQGAEPTATYVDARRSSDGLDVDRAACVAALKR